jgi:hypothetical protein
MVEPLGNAIAVGDTSLVKRILDKIPVERLDEADSDKLLINAIQAALLVGPAPQETIRLVLQRWMESDVTGHLVSTPVYLTMLPTPTWFQDFRNSMEQQLGLEPFDVIIQALKDSLAGWNYFFFVQELIHQDSSPLVEMALNRLDRVYGLQDKEVYLALQNELDRQRSQEGTYNHVVRQRVDQLLEEVGDWAPIPDYMGNFYGTEEDPFLLPREGEIDLEETSHLLEKFPSAEEAANVILEDIQKGFKEAQLALPTRQAFISTYNSSSLEEKLRLLQINPDRLKKELEALEIASLLETDPDTLLELEAADFIEALHLHPTTLEFRDAGLVAKLGVEEVDAFKRFLVRERTGQERSDLLGRSMKDLQSLLGVDLTVGATDFMNFLGLEAEVLSLPNLAKAQKFGLDADVLRELENDRIVFNFLGPANPIFGPLDPDSTCCRYGGCRMFTCIDLENEDEFGVIDYDNPEESIEWFTGSCEYCHRKIAKPIYAVRRPFPFGGWKGCFCSFKCLRAVVPLQDVITHFIINLVENEMNEFKIQDRNFEDEPTTTQAQALARLDAQEQAYGTTVEIESQSLPQTIETEY